MLPAPQVPLELQELITPRPARETRLLAVHNTGPIDHLLPPGVPPGESTVNLDHLGPPEERSVWILCSRFERRVQGAVTAYGCLGDGKCPLRPATAAVLRADGTGGPRRPGTDRRHPVLVFTAPFAQADAEDDLDRVVAVHSEIVRADQTASGAHANLPRPHRLPKRPIHMPVRRTPDEPSDPTERGRAGARRCHEGRSDRPTRAPGRTRRSSRTRKPATGPARGGAEGSASHLARRHPRPTRRAAYAAVDTVRQPLTRIAREPTAATGSSGCDPRVTATASPRHLREPAPRPARDHHPADTTKTAFPSLRKRPLTHDFKSRDDRI